MTPEVQRILIIALAVVVVIVVALIFGRRLKVIWGDKSVETDRGRPTMSMSATHRGSITDAKQIAEGDAAVDMAMTARHGGLQQVEQRTGKRPDGSS